MGSSPLFYWAWAQAPHAHPTELCQLGQKLREPAAALLGPTPSSEALCSRP